MQKVKQKPRVICRKCGKCCIILNKGKWEKCKFLTKNNLCRIYKNRLGQKLGSGFYCVERDKLPWDIPDCPYNTGKPFHPFYINK